MDYNDFMTGRNQTARAADAAIDKWEAYANDLRRKLNQAQNNLAEAESKFVRSAAREAGRDAQQRALREALAQINPSHPLLESLPQIGGKAMVESCAHNGYHYSPETGLLRKL